MLFKIRVKCCTYLNTGTGDDCAWHNKAKLVFSSLTNVMLLASLLKVGALNPMGSVDIYIKRFSDLF